MSLTGHEVSPVALWHEIPHLHEAGFVDRQLVRVPRVDLLLGKVDDGDLEESRSVTQVG